MLHYSRSELALRATQTGSLQHIVAPYMRLQTPLAKHRLRLNKRRAGVASKCSSTSTSPSSDGGGQLERIVFLPGGNAVSLTPRRRTELWPSLQFSSEDAVQQQLEALRHNNTPHVDHGVEVLYRFADFDPFNPRCSYFGRSFDLGQFERFRRILHTSHYATLLGHEEAVPLSSLQVSEHVWAQRVLVRGPLHCGTGQRDEGVYTFTMKMRMGGLHDGYWFTQSLLADGNDWGYSHGPPPRSFI